MKRHLLKYRYLPLLFLLLESSALAHGGEDHGEASAVAVPVGGVAAGMLTSYGLTDGFEVVVRYASTNVGEPVPTRFLISDYATNEPITGAGFTLASTPSGVSLQTPPRMISPGIYEAALQFPADTIYNLVMTLRAGNRSDLLEIRNIYAGSHAERFLAEHSSSGSGDVAPSSSEQTGGAASWLWWSGALLLVIAGGWFLLQRRRKSVHGGDDTERQSVQPATNDKVKS